MVMKVDLVRNSEARFGRDFEVSVKHLLTIGDTVVQIMKMNFNNCVRTCDMA